MCGILFSCTSVQDEPDSNFQTLFSRLKVASASRGPDGQDTVNSRLGSIQLTFVGSELRLRGDSYISQPHRDIQGNILCWNGEIFEGMEISPEENDGVKLFSVLRELTTPEDIRDILGSIEGPYAMVYYHHNLRKLFFTRDPLGRRSLLMQVPTPASPQFLLASVSVGANPGYCLEELSTVQIYCLDIESLSNTPNFVFDFARCLSTIPRQNPHSPKLFAELAKVNRTLPETPPLLADISDIPEYLSQAVDQLIYHLERSVRLRVSNIPQQKQDKGGARVAVLFSGGIDSTVIAFLAHYHVDPEEPIDLLNVAFENPRKIRVQAEGNLGGLPKREKKQKMRDRVDYSEIDVTYHVPDRVTGLQEVEELRRLCPGRIWNFVEINVPFEEYQIARPIVEEVMFPGRTVMDLSLAMALYFAAQGVGDIRSHPGAPPEPYTSSARVLLNGLGSDELLGGYGRFRTAYKAAGWQAIIDELQLELDRIPTRNLGRDDRVISSHGKETRHPFLSLSVVSYLAQLPVHLKMDPRLEAGLGEKMLLRLAAHKVGLVEASRRKKRAMQFGSHSARMAPGAGDKKGDLLLSERIDVE